MKKRNLFMILIVIMTIIALSVFIVLHFNNKAKYDYQIEKISQIDYHIINKEDRYGVIDRQGNIIVEPIYDIVQIPNPSKDVFVCMYDYSIEEKEYKVKVFNKESEQIYKEYANIQGIQTETTYDGIPYEKSVLKYKANGKYGLLSIDGKEITKPVYEQISAITYKEGMLLVKQGEQSGVINMNGKQVIPVEYESITADNYYNKDSLYQKAGFIVSKKNEDGYRYGYIDYKGKKIIDTQYTEIERVVNSKDDKNIYLVALKDGQAGLLKNKKVLLNYEYEDISYNAYNDVFVLQRNGKQGIADKQGKIKIPTEYESILFGGIYINATKDEKLSILDLEGNKIENQDILAKIPTEDGKNFIVCDQNEVYKIVNDKGEVIIDKKYSNIEELENNYFVVSHANNSGVIDLTGKSLVDLKYNSIFQIEGTEVYQANISKTGTITLLNSDMEVLETMDNAEIAVEGNYIKLYSNTQMKYFDLTGKEVSSKEVYPTHKLYAKKINDTWGFVDKEGNVKVQNEYDMVTEFNEYGFAGIKKDGKWGSINEEGKVVQEPVYKIDTISPKFIGKLYQDTEWYGDMYYTDKIKK